MNEFQKNRYAFSGRTHLRIAGESVIEARGKEIASLIHELTSYKVLLRDLPDYEGDYNIRNELINIAFFIINDFDLYNKFLDEKELSVNLLATKIAKPKKFLSYWIDYITAYIIIYGSPEYEYIQDYVKVIELEKPKKDSKEKNLVKYEDNSTRGIILSKNKVNCIMLTLSGEFKRIKVKQAVSRGEEIEGVKSKGFKDYKMKLSIFMLLIVAIGSVIGWQYTSSITTIVVESTNTVKIEVNSFNRVISIESNEASGNKLINSIDVVDKSIDTALSTVMESIYTGKMIPDGGVIVTISGEPIKYNAITKTEDYIFINNMEVKFNNNGIEHKLD